MNSQTHYLILYKVLISEIRTLLTAKSLKIFSPVKTIESQYLIPDSQFLSNFFDAQVAMHDVLKMPT